MSEKRNQLLLAALQRAGKPVGSEELLDLAVGLAVGSDWIPEQVALNRKSIAKRLQNMELTGEVVQCGSGMDESSRRTTPLYKPTAGYNPAAEVPPPPTVSSKPELESPYEGLDRSQLLAVLDVHEAFAECVGRFMTDLNQLREKARRRLTAAGLER
ncbi:MAG: hypothetical protein WA777_18460 [Rhodanobacter sp.]